MAQSDSLTMLDASAVYSPTPPAPFTGRRWVDTSSDQSVSRYWDGIEWVRWALSSDEDTTASTGRAVFEAYIPPSETVIVTKVLIDTDNVPYVPTSLGSSPGVSILMDVDGVPYTVVD